LGIAAIFAGFTILLERVVNGFRLRCRQRIQSDIAPKTRKTHQVAAMAIDIPKFVAEMLIGSDHDAHGS
jgi:hypothetical protein